jgi:hypothetical protein
LAAENPDACRTGETVERFGGLIMDYILRIIQGFKDDPPHSDWERGYLTAMLDAKKELNIENQEQEQELYGGNHEQTTW